MIGMWRGPVKKARSIPAQGDEVYIEGFGQNIPFDDNSFNGVIFFNSLHHILPDHIKTALLDASRVVNPEGLIYIAEPLASAAGFELHAPMDDQTAGRALALKVQQETAEAMSRMFEVTY